MTSMVVGFQLIDASGTVLQSWGGEWGFCPPMPNPLHLPNGDVVLGPELNTDYSGHQIVEWNMDEPPPPPPPPPVVPESITRRQCALQLFAVGMITGPEAVAMARDGTPPASVQAAFDTLPEPNKTLALIDFAASNYYRASPLIPSLMAANGMTEEQVDQFFVEASTL